MPPGSKPRMTLERLKKRFDCRELPSLSVLSTPPSKVAFSVTSSLRTVRCALARKVDLMNSSSPPSPANCWPKRSRTPRVGSSPRPMVL